MCIWNINVNIRVCLEYKCKCEYTCVWNINVNNINVCVWNKCVYTRVFGINVNMCVWNINVNIYKCEYVFGI